VEGPNPQHCTSCNFVPLKRLLLNLFLLLAEEEDVRKKRKLSDAEGEETPSKAARTEAVHPAPEPENRVPLPSGTSPAGYSSAFVWGCNNVR
jgi:hypothetical protein